MAPLDLHRHMKKGPAFGHRRLLAAASAGLGSCACAREPCSLDKEALATTAVSVEGAAGGAGDNRWPRKETLALFKVEAPSSIRPSSAAAPSSSSGALHLAFVPNYKDAGRLFP